MTMDCFVGKKKGKQCDDQKHLRGLTERVRIFQEEVKAIMNEREKESRAYERDVMVFAFKEAEWKQERKKLKEEVKRLRKAVEEKEERVRKMEDGCEKNVEELLGGSTTLFLAEQMREERVRRDETVEKWKTLYLAIKIELDDLIQETHRDGLYWRAEEEEIIEELKMEVKGKERTIEELKAQLALVKHEEQNRAREVDILRQSLKIISSKKASSFDCSRQRRALVKQAWKV